MQTIINYSRRPVVVVETDGTRKTIKPRSSIKFNGDLRHHPWVKSGKLEIGTAEQIEGDDDLDAVRVRYQNIFGKKPHGNASKEKLLQEIEEWRNQPD